MVCSFGQCCLLGALIASGYAALVLLLGARRGDRAAAGSAPGAAVVAFLALTLVMGVLAWALIAKDFSFSYVAHYSSRHLPWYYSLSALWVGQAGSLLLWAWLLGLVALWYWFHPRRQESARSPRAFGVLMAYSCFLVGTMVFAADPMEPSLLGHTEGSGLSPLLQHPAMLIHPPIVFLGYALWAVPFALAVTFADGRFSDSHWIREARPWALSAWTVLGLGIVLGGKWAYEELGWGGYWAWDPVENGSLMPWLTGTALLHCLMAWQYRGIFKKTSLALALGTFGLCNFATFLTRSGIFSSLHAFSKSPIGWLFLLLMLTITVHGSVLLLRCRGALRPERALVGLWTREAMVGLSTVALLLLTAVTFTGTLMVPLSKILTGHSIVVGAAFFNYTAIPVGLWLLAATALAPLLSWGHAPNWSPRAGWIGGVMLSLCVAAGIALGGWQRPLFLVVICGAVCGLASVLISLWLDARPQSLSRLPGSMARAIRKRRTLYTGFLIHLGFSCLMVGIAGSALDSRRLETSLREGDSVEWSGYTIRLCRLQEQTLPDRLVGQAVLELSRGGRPVCQLLPSQDYHLLQQERTTEVAIHATWSGDFYTILHGRSEAGDAELTFVFNPLMRWIWLGSWILALATLVRLWPRARRPLPHQPLPAPKTLRGQVSETHVSVSRTW